MSPTRTSPTRRHASLHRHAPLLGLATLAALALNAPPPAAAQFAAPTVVMSGLDNPHGMVFGPDGGLYVAEAGSGGNGPSIVGGDGSTDFYGLTGAISRLLGGVQTRVVAGLPSLANQGGGSGYGPEDLAFDHAGNLYAVMGFGPNPSLRATLDADGVSGDAFGQLVKFNLTDGSRQNVADVSAFEADNNPDGADSDSNPYSLLHLADGTFIVADASGNDLVKVNPDTGKVTLLTVFKVRPNPLPMGPPTYQAVPDAIVIGPDKAYYVGELTGYPFPEGAAEVLRVDPATGAATVAATGFTNIADLAFSPDGTLNVLEISENGLANPNGPVPGALFNVNLASGTKTLIADTGLVFPTGMTVGPGGALYVANQGVSPTGGQVLRFAPALSITSLNPQAATAGASAFPLTVYGTDFVSGAVVKWNGAAQSTTFVSASELTASIPAALVAKAGTATVTVGVSGGASFAIDPAAPSTTVSSLTLTRDARMVGQTSLGKVTLSDTAPSGGAVVTLSSSDPGAASVPASVTIGAGDKSVSFHVVANGVPVRQTVTIMASVGSSSQSATLTVLPTSAVAVR